MSVILSRVLLLIILATSTLTMTGCGSKHEGLHSFASHNFPDQYIRHQNNEGWITLITSELEKKDASFHIIPGLSDTSAYSFESANYPGMFLRHRDSKIFLEAIALDNAIACADATFKIVAGLADNSKVSFESVNYPKHYIRHSSYRLILALNDDSEIFKADATFTSASSLK